MAVQRTTNLTQVIRPVEQEGNKAHTLYAAYYHDNDDAALKRKEDCAEVSSMFYDLVTDFYEYGWGTGFHFCSMRTGESFEHSLAKYEYRLALKLELKPGMKCLDAGCGVGGPARNIAIFSGATIMGINNNKYQIEKCKFYTKNQGVEDICKYIEGDYNNMPFPENTYDAAFTIESTCYSEGKKVFGEIYRILKPGAKYATYEWVLTDKYDPDNKEHVRIKDGLLFGNGLPELQTVTEMIKSLKAAGFKILETQDHKDTGNLPWYYYLQGRWTLTHFRSTPLGVYMAHCMLWVLETVRLSPPGSVKAHGILVEAAKNLLKAGQLGIFSPSYLVVAEKPVHQF